MRSRRIEWRRFTLPGHSKYEKYILDTHDHPVIDPVWQLYARAIERCGPTPTLLEWDDHIPSFDEVHAEAKKAEKYLQRHCAAMLDAERGAMNLESQLQREMAAAVMLPLTADEQMRANAGRPLDGGDCRVVHRSQQPAYRIRASGNLQPPVLVSRSGRAGGGFPGAARGGWCARI